MGKATQSVKALFMKLRPLLGIIVLLAGCADHRQHSHVDDLTTRAAAVSRQQLGQTRAVIATAVSALVADRAAGRPPCLDILHLSGGGSWGAFGAGFLHGWGDVPGDQPLAMPRFDIVSGVSTGALITPFALLGTPEALARVDTMYRSSQEDWVSMRSMISLPGANSLLDTDVLDGIIRGEMDAQLAKDLVTAQEQDFRQAIVASSDIDLGRPVLWRLGDQARLGLASQPYDPNRLFVPLRASAAIPGAFPPVDVDGSLHVDGAVYGQIHVLGDMRIIDWLVADWRTRAGPDAPLPTVRYWVILNNRLKVDRATVQPVWSTIAMRSIGLMFSAQIAAPLNRLALFAESIRLRHHMNVELRWVQIPEEWQMPAEVSDFHPSVTTSLSDLGRRLGRDPTSWHGAEELGLAETESATFNKPELP